MAKFELGQNVVHASQIGRTVGGSWAMRDTANVMTIIGVGNMQSHNGSDTIYSVSFMSKDGQICRAYVDEQELAPVTVPSKKVL